MISGVWKDFLNKILSLAKNKNTQSRKKKKINKFYYIGIKDFW